MSATTPTSRAPVILAVCRGNVCRSPLVEQAVREAAARTGVDVVVDSAGTHVRRDGARPDRRMRRAAKRAGITLTSRTRQLSSDDLRDADLVLVMDSANRADVEAMRHDVGGTAQVRLFKGFDERARTHELPDPYMAPAAWFDMMVGSIGPAVDGVVAWAADTGPSVAAQHPVAA